MLTALATLVLPALLPAAADGLKGLFHFVEMDDAVEFKRLLDISSHAVKG